MFKKSFHAIITLLISLSFCQAQNFERIERQVDSLLRTSQVPSIAIAVLKDGKILYEQAFGYADLEKKKKSTIYTPYQLASLTKPITATAIMKLHQQGIIDIDDPISKYISLQKTDKSFRTPSIRQVLNHTAGLGTYFDIYYEDENVVPLSFTTAWKKYGYIFQEPGQVSEYSNLGYGLLSYLIKQYASKSFPGYLKAELFDALGMKNAFVIEKGAYKNQALAKKYDHKMNPLPAVWNNTPGAGNIAASIQDLMRFAAFHLQKKKTDLLNPRLIREMQTYKEPNALFHYYQNTFYGLGWYVMPDDNGQRVIWHEGGMMGASTVLKLYPDEDIAIILLSNTYAPQVCRALTDSIATVVIPNYKPTPINEIAEYSPVSSDTTMIGRWEGLMHIEEKSIPISLLISAEAMEIRYLDEGFSSFLTDYQALPYTSKLLFGAVNQNYFIGTGMGELPASDKRKNHPHLLSFKLLKKETTIRGTITSLAAADREYYAHPYSIELRKVVLSP